MKLKCVFKENVECPVRTTLRKSLKHKKDIDKYLKPLGDAELMKIFAPIFDKMESVIANEFGLLHNYCRVCPLRRKDLENG